MKTAVFRLLAILMVVGLAASCGGGGDDDQYNFGGRWAYSEVITTSTVKDLPVGTRISDVLIISQNGTAITVTWQTWAATLTMTGTCDPERKTFNASGTSAEGVFNSISGGAVDGDSMSGVTESSKGSLKTTGAWTADLTGRSISGTRLSDTTGTKRTLSDVLVR